MYALILVECSSFNHATALRRMLEGDGFPAVAATVKMGDLQTEAHVVATAAPKGYPELLSGVARGFAEHADGLEAIDRINNAPGHTVVSLAIPEAQRDIVRSALAAAVHYAADKVSVMEPAGAGEDAAAGHDPGDEHAVPVPVKNPAGGGWEKRCQDDPRAGVSSTAHLVSEPTDHYDAWKSAR